MWKLSRTLKHVYVEGRVNNSVLKMIMAHVRIRSPKVKKGKCEGKA